MKTPLDPPASHTLSLRSVAGLVALAALCASQLAPPSAGQLALVRQGKESRAAREAGDGFAFALASGDFNGDGYMDVASGSPFEEIGGLSEQSGGVVISYGGPYGLTWVNAELLLATDQFLVPDNDQAWFGYALAAGDFDGDGLDDLAVGAPMLDWSGVTDTGGVYLYLGGAGTTGSLEGQVPLVYDQSLFSAAVESGDRFGSALCAANLDGDAYDDLLIGGPGENLASGAIYGGYGNGTAIVPDSSLTIAAAAAGAPGQANDQFGTTVLIADVLDGPEPDLIVSAPYQDFTGSIADSGGVYVIPMSASGPKLASTVFLDANRWGLPFQAGALFGMGLAAGDFRLDGDASLDLAIGAPGDNNGEGHVYVADGNPVSFGFPFHFDQARGNDFIPPITEAETPEPGDNFGWSLAVCDHDGDGLDDLAIGSPGETVPDAQGVLRNDSGALTILLGDPGELGIGTDDATYTELTLNTVPLANARLGESLAVGDNDDDPGVNVFVGAPGWNANTGQYYDIAPWRQVYGMQANSALAGGCVEEIYFALRPFDTERTASTGKIMTTLLACEAAQLPPSDPDHVPLSQQYTIPAWLDNAFEVTGCSAYDFVAGEILTFETLIRLTMMVSANDATYGIADLVADDIVAWVDSEATVPNFVALMNSRAQELGMVDTTFGNPSGIDTPNQWSTTYDMWLLTKEAMKNPLFQDMAGTVQYDYVRMVPHPFGTLPIETTIGYSWLNGMMSAVPEVIGVKNGTTSVHTRVAAARPQAFPWGTTYGLVYGVPEGTDSASGWSFASLYTVQLLQMAMPLCQPTILWFFPPPDQVTDPHVIDGLSLDNAGDQTQVSVQLSGRNLGDQDDPSQVDLHLDFDLGFGFDAKISYTLKVGEMMRSEAGENQKMGVERYEGHDGIRIANPDEVDPVDLTIQVSHPPTAWDATLLPGETFLIPADTSGDSAAPFVLTIINNSLKTRLVQVDATYLYTSVIGLGNETFSATLNSPTNLVRSMAHLTLEAGTDPSVIESFALTVKDPTQISPYAPCTASWSNYGAGWPGELGVPLLVADQPPVLGTTTNVLLGNSSPSTATGLLLVGNAPDNAPTVWGGSLLVTPDTLLPQTIPSAGLTLPLPLPATSILCGVKSFGQLAVIDPMASLGVSFSRGLELEFGF